MSGFWIGFLGGAAVSGIAAALAVFLLCQWQTSQVRALYTGLLEASKNDRDALARTFMAKTAREVGAPPLKPVSGKDLAAVRKRFQLQPGMKA